MPIAPGQHESFGVVSMKPGSKWGYPPLALQGLSWEASAVGLSMQVFEAGTLKHGEWGRQSVQLYPIMIALACAGSWQLDPSLPVHLVNKHARVRIVIANLAEETIKIRSLVLWGSLLEGASDGS